MRFVWDEDKRQANVRKHGIDFVDALKVFDGLAITFQDDRFDYGEFRYVTLGLLNGRVIVMAHTEQDDRIRIISARKATKNEEIGFFREIANRLGTR